MRGHPAKQLVVDGAVQAQALITRGRAQALGQFDFDAVVMFEIRRGSGRRV
jgi:hypothetical protein